MNIDNATIGSRLQAARRALGLTQTEAGSKMGMVTSTISAIEAGKRSVTGTELYQFARLYQRPITYFLEMGETTTSPGFQYLFRKVDEKLLDRSSIVKLEQLAADYELLEELVEATTLPMPPDYAGFGFHGEQNAETLAEMERARLGLGDAPLSDLMNLLDNAAGIRTFMLPVEKQSWSGLVVRDPTGRPCIAVNSKEQWYRRNFSLAHEYAHALVHIAGTDAPQARVDFVAEGGRSTVDERFADAFAAAFLMPRRAVLGQLERNLRANAGKFTDYDLVHLAMQFGVSGQAMSLRLVTLRKLPRQAYATYWNRNQNYFADLVRALGYEVDDEDWKLPVVLPARFRYLAVKAYQEGIISLAKLAELLRKNLYELRGELPVTQDLATQTGAAG